ncbi:MAG: DinB family protein [Ferruginibacter sp.]
MPKPAVGSYPAYFENYVNQVPENDLFEAIKNQQIIVETYFKNIDEEKSNYAYAPGKWTLKEMLQHVIDTERIFNFRALAFARKDHASLPGFDENNYAANSNANQREWKGIFEELIAVRRSTDFMFNSFDINMLNATGISNNNPASVLAMGFVTVGHLYHHINIIETRYMEV